MRSGERSTDIKLQPVFPNDVCEHPIYKSINETTMIGVDIAFDAPLQRDTIINYFVVGLRQTVQENYVGTFLVEKKEKARKGSTSLQAGVNQLGKYFGYDQIKFQIKPSNQYKTDEENSSLSGSTAIYPWWVTVFYNFNEIIGFEDDLLLNSFWCLPVEPSYPDN